jgi:drug/metabolite transporter (DMT)-like permease
VLAAYGAVVLGERGGWRLWLGLSMAVLGLALLLMPGWAGFDARFRFGIAFGLGTAVAYGGFLIAFRAAQGQRARTSNEVLLWWMCVLSAAVLLVMTWLGGEAWQPRGLRDWSALLAYALIAQVFGWLVIGRVMPKLPAGVLGLCLLLQPLLSYVWDALLFGTRLGPVGLLGLALSLAGIFLGLVRGQRRPADAAQNRVTAQT